MPDDLPPIINIAIVGGGTYCKEILEKTTADYREREVNARFRIVADPDPHSPGMIVAKNLRLKTLSDYRDLYDPNYNIHLIIILTPQQDIFEDILSSRPPHIRILSYHVFEIFWKAIGLEERKLRERTTEIETILNGIQDFILVITPDRKIVDVNDSFLKMMGHSRKELIGRKCYDVFQEVSRDQYKICDTSCPMNDVIRNRRPCQMVLDQVDSSGQSRYIEVSIHPIWEEDGKISKFIEISRDISVRLKEEEEITNRLEQMVEERTRQLKETHDKLLHQDKMASLGKLSASVVHEINNPIAGILNLTMLLKRMIKVETDLDTNMPDFIGSEDQLQQVFMNMVSNAAESMESTDGGTLSITTQHSLKDNRFIISFRDTGVGVPHDNLSNLFEPFFTTKKGKGVGLGLSVVYGIIQEHGGFIDAKSKEGKGTTFKIELPIERRTENTDRTGELHG